MDHCEGARAFDVTCHCEGAREDLRNCRGKVTSLATAQEHVTFGFASKQLAKKIGILKKEGAIRKPRILAQVQEHFFHKIFCQFFSSFFS